MPVARIFASGCRCCRQLALPPRQGLVALRNARFFLIAGALATVLLGGCDSTGILQSRHKPATQIYEQLPLDVNPVVAALQLISELPQRDPAGQAELFQ